MLQTLAVFGIQHAGLASSHHSLHVFKLFLRQYAYCPEHDMFEAVPAMPAQIPLHICKALDSLQSICTGAAILLHVHTPSLSLYSKY